MPKYYCDYCDTYLTHDSPSVRKTHCAGRKHKENVKFYYQKWMEEQAQSLIDATTAAFKAGKLPGGMPPGGPGGVAIPPPMGMRPPPGKKNWFFLKFVRFFKKLNISLKEVLHKSLGIRFVFYKKSVKSYLQLNQY